MDGNCHHVAAEVTMPGKRVQFDDETWHALDLLAKDRRQTFQELADEAFADLLRKHGRPTDLKMALRQSVAGMDRRPPSASVKRDGRKKAASNDNG
jgi:predicted transcriptional regulator